MSALQEPPLPASLEVDADDAHEADHVENDEADHDADDSAALLYNLVYCSRAAADVDAAAVARIVAAAQRYNAEHHITGMLVYGSGIFFQWLEGPRANVARLMARLQSDPRHHHMVELTAAEEVRERMFPQWDMELVSGQDIRAVLSDALEAAQDPQRAAALGRLLDELDNGQLHGLVPV